MSSWLGRGRGGFGEIDDDTDVGGDRIGPGREYRIEVHLGDVRKSVISRETLTMISAMASRLADRCRARP